MNITLINDDNDKELSIVQQDVNLSIGEAKQYNLNIAATGIRGLKGDKGDKGDPGENSNLSAGLNIEVTEPVAGEVTVATVDDPDFTGVHFDTANPMTIANAGDIAWNSVDGTLDVKLLNDVTLQSGQELHFYGKAQGAIANGDLCQFAGVQGDHILIKKVVASEVKANHDLLIGVATTNIANGSFGYVTWFGKVNNVYTTGWTAGDLLYMDNSTGQLTKTAPVAPQHKITVAVVIKEATGAAENGTLLVRPTHSYQIGELEDTKLASLSNGQVLKYNSATSTWDNATLAISDTNGLQAALDTKVAGNTAITGATKTKITYDAKGLVTAGADATTADIADSSNKRYVTDANLTVINNTSGTNTGDNATNSQYSGLDAAKVNKAGDTMTGNLNMGTNTLIGGTAVTDTLKLQGTTGNGASTSPAIQLLTGNNGANTAMTILNNGRVGIGTTSPGAKLQVDTGAAATVGQIIKGAAAQTADLIQVQNSSGTVLSRFNSTGKLSVNNTGSTHDINVNSIRVGTAFNYTPNPADFVVGSPTSNSRFIFGQNNSVAGGMTWWYNPTPANAYLTISADTGSTSTITNQLVLRRDGNIGIGTTSPGAKLQVDTGATATVGQIIRGAAGQTADLWRLQDSAGSTLASVSSSGAMKYLYGGPTGSVLQNVATDTYIQSRGQDLVTNGSGLLSNNTNFSGLVYDSVEKPGGLGSFKATSGATSRFIDEFIPVNPKQTYRFKYEIKNTWKSDPASTVRHYGAIVSYDASNTHIHIKDVNKVSNSTYTSLAADLNNGDTTITLTNATGWHNGATGHQRTINFYPYTDNTGYTWPAYTYTKNWAEDVWASGGITGNVITLKTPWAGGFKPAGTKVANGSSGGTYEYVGAANVEVTDQWVSYEGSLGPIGPEYVLSEGDVATSAHMYSAPGGFRWGTGSVKIGWLLNYGMSVGQTATTNVGNIEFGLDRKTLIGGINIRGDYSSPTTTPLTVKQIDYGYGLVVKHATGSASDAISGIGFASMGSDLSGYVKGAIFYQQNNTAGRGDLIFANAGAAGANNVSVTDEKMRLTNAGNLGIGTASPAEKLDVSGTVKATGYKSSDGSAGVSGSFTTTDGKTITIKDGLVTSIV